MRFIPLRNLLNSCLARVFQVVAKSNQGAASRGTAATPGGASCTYEVDIGPAGSRAMG